MALKFNIQVDKKAVQEAVDAAPVGYTRYDGPTPPPGLYNFKLTKLWAGENKDGTEVLIARLVLDEEDTGGDDSLSTYNGFTVFDRLTIPMNQSDQYFDRQVRSMDDFFQAISDGEYTIFDFTEDASNGKIQEDGEAGNMGTPIKQIGRLKIGNNRTLRAKTKQSGQYTNIHFIDVEGSIGKGLTGSKGDDDDIDDFFSPWDGGEEGDSDIDDLLGDI